MEYQPAKQTKYPSDPRYSLLLRRDQIRLPQVQHERRVLRIPPAIHLQTVQKLPDSVYRVSRPPERHTDRARLRDVIGDCGRFGGRISQLRGSLRELQHYANETREYRRFPTPHESKPPFGLSETSRLYRVYGVGDGVVK